MREYGSGRPAVFLDRDGTIIHEVNYLADPDLLEMIPGALEALQALQRKGFSLVVVTNQAGIARGYFSLATLTKIHARLYEELAKADIRLDGLYFCPHHPDVGEPPYRTVCSCRKPEPGMILRAADELGICLERSYMIGDKLSDTEAGRRAGCTSILVRTGWGRQAESELADDRKTAVPDHLCNDLLEASHWILNRQ